MFLLGFFVYMYHLHLQYGLQLGSPNSTRSPECGPTYCVLLTSQQMKKAKSSIEAKSGSNVFVFVVVISLVWIYFSDTIRSDLEVLQSGLLKQMLMMTKQMFNV